MTPAVKKQTDDDLRVPPHNIEAEQSVLGCLMLDKDAVIKIADLLKVGDFYKDIHNLIYDAMLELYEQREPLDVLSISNKLDERKQLEKIGGSSYLASLVGTVPSASHIVHYAKVVQKKALLRRLIHAATEILEAGYNEGDDIEKILDDAEQKLFGVSQKYIKQDSTDEMIDEAWNAMILDFPKERINFLLSCKSKYRTFLLSNTNAIHFPVYNNQLKENFQINNLSDLFEKAYYSYRLGLRKPDKEIFEMVLKENNLNPEETLFIDDSPAHIATADKLGIKTILLKHTKTLMDIAREIKL